MSRGKAIRGVGVHMQSSQASEVQIGPPTGGKNGDIKVNMDKGSIFLSMKAGDKWYSIPAFEHTAPALKSNNLGEVEFAGPINAKDNLKIKGSVSYIDIGSQGDPLEGNLAIGSNSKLSLVYAGDAWGTEQARPLGKLDKSYNQNVNNLAIGNNTMVEMKWGIDNIAIGYKAMEHVGGQVKESLFPNNNWENIAIGARALNLGLASHGNYSNDNVSRNIAIGGGAMAFAKYAGRNDLHSDTPCYENVAIGSGAGSYITGQQNVAIGDNALQGGQTSNGDDNIAIGTYAMSGWTTADDNIAIGYRAGATIDDGDKNICIGYEADITETNAQNQIAIGHSTVTTGQYGIAIGDNISAAGNDAVMGKSGATITVDFDASGTWAQSSDIRKKRNIKDDNLGLTFINDLNTKTYQWRPAKEHPEEWGNFIDKEDGTREYSDINTGVVMHGLIAQDVKEAMDKAGCNTFGGWKEDGNGQQEVSKAMFVIPLIKAVQELSAKIDTMQTEINNLK